MVGKKNKNLPSTGWYVTPKESTCAEPQESVPGGELLSALASLLSEPKYSNLTILCGNEFYLVHQCIICTRSPFFARACGENFEEASTHVITLKEDPALVKQMIEYFYTLNYKVESHSSSSHGCIMNSNSTAEASEEPAISQSEGSPVDPVNHTPEYYPLSFHILMYSLADRLFIEGLKALSKEKVEQELFHAFHPMRSNYSFSPNHDDGTYEAESWRWDESPQYAPTPGNFGHTPSSPSHFSYIDTNPTTPAEFLPPQTNSSRTEKLPLLQFRDWVEGKSYDEDPPTCIHYWIEWKITLNKRTVIEDTEQDLVLAPGFHWRLFLQPKLREKLDAKYPHKKLVIDDTSIMLTVPRVDKVDQQFPKTDINWPEIEKQLYAIMRCPGSCELGLHYWQDPYGKKHYKLYRDEILSLVRYVQSRKILDSHEDMPGMIRDQIYRAGRRRLLEGQKGHNRISSESNYPLITITNVLPAQTSQQAISSSIPSSEGMATSSTSASRLNIAGLRDANIQTYYDWQQSQVGHASWKVEFQKACDVALDNGLDLDQIDELSDPEYFENQGVKWGIARRFIRDIRYWAETRIRNVDD
ncbi:hypothetical protein BDV12DRAFT_193439 [Aspergillus spectabilis]